MSTSPGDGAPDDAPARRPQSPPGDPARAVETNVREVNGHFVVEITVVFDDGVVNRTVNTYRTRRHAEIAASWIQRAANRDIRGPVNG